MIADRYTFEREIGRGGMGAVWLGEDKVLGRPVALKRIGRMPGATSPDAARAEREARLAARINHPHVVAVFNLIVAEDGERWLVMEYVDGLTLAEYVRRRGHLTPDEAAPLLAQAADALAAAHAEGVVHRDVKPSNILVDRQGHVKLTDFGIAKGSAEPPLTQTGLLSGSPAYLAPEVAAGRSATAASDVWSLGATAYHLLAGRPPYDIGDNVLGGLYRIVNEDPPRLPDAGWLAPLLEATMTKDPAQRWSMAQVHDFLTAPADDREATQLLGLFPSAGDQGGPAEHAGPVAPAEGHDRRRSTAWLAGILAVAMLVVVGVVVLAVVLAALPGDDPADRAGASPDPTPRSSASPSPSPESPASTPAQATAPTAAGMTRFVHDYVAALGTDPRAAWQMLTPRFRRASGGWANYRDFWSGVGTGRVLEVSADPQTLVVTYRVRFENFGTGRRPTVLDLVHEGGRYLIDNERTEGFVPAG